VAFFCSQTESTFGFERELNIILQVSEMLFHLLRTYLRDEEFAETSTKLRQATALLAEYEQTLKAFQEVQLNTITRLLQEERTARLAEEKEKVELDFIVIVFGSIALALTIGSFAASRVPHLSINSSIGVTDVVWLFLSLGSLLFVGINGLFAFRLLRNYAKSKSDPRYQTFVISISLGIAAVIICVIVLMFAGFALP
jgi:hypothetical protein